MELTSLSSGLFTRLGLVDAAPKRNRQVEGLQMVGSPKTVPMEFFGAAPPSQMHSFCSCSSLPHQNAGFLGVPRSTPSQSCLPLPPESASPKRTVFAGCKSSRHHTHACRSFFWQLPQFLGAMPGPCRALPQAQILGAPLACLQAELAQVWFCQAL